MQLTPDAVITVIMGLGNPGPRFNFTRHNSGFMIVDALADKYHGNWQYKGDMEYCEIMIGDKKIMLVKPQTYMNESGKVIPALQKKGIKAENILVVHDELEKPFGAIVFKQGGSHRGHNGLRSLISVAGPDFLRLRFGVDRPENKEDVPDYVLHKFSQDPADVALAVDKAVVMIEKLFE